MPFGMGPAGWWMWPYAAQSMSHWYPWYGPYWSPLPYAPMTKEQETAMLEDQAKVLEDQLAEIKSRLAELEKAK